MDKTHDTVLGNTNISLTNRKGLTFTGNNHVTCAAAIRHRFFIPGSSCCTIEQNLCIVMLFYIYKYIQTGNIYIYIYYLVLMEEKFVFLNHTAKCKGRASEPEQCEESLHIKRGK